MNFFEWLAGLAVVAAMTAASIAQADEMITVGNPEVIDPGAERTALVITPEAVKTMARKAGQSNHVEFDLMLGSNNGLRIEYIPFPELKYAPVLEAFAGGGPTTAGLSGEIGGGLRLQIRAVANEKNALYVSPGLDVYVLTADSSSGVLHLGPYSNVVYLTANTKVEYEREIRPHLGFDVGMEVGAAVALSGQDVLNVPAAGRPTPDLMLFTGLRF
ncbi:MAG: hypothetical protein ACXWP5_13165 [Bdellovibrionota bacterium]